MMTVCSVKSIRDRLQKRGLGDIKFQRMSGKHCLLSFDDDDLYIMLEDLNWSYLKEVFSEVGPWSEECSYKERATWIEVSGMPQHCWNHSLKRLVGFWGKLEAFGENVIHCIDCEKCLQELTKM
ncbi:hypothetical protein V6N13_053754 [Hibiscus sabdariffa]